MDYSIGEAARLLGVAPSTLRYYDKEGLLPYVRRTEGGMRVFTESDIDLLKIIGCLKKTGMQLNDIKEYIRLVRQGDGTIGERLELFRKQKAAVEEQLRQLNDTYDVVRYKCWYYETALKAGSVRVHDGLSDEDIPEEILEIRNRLL